MIKMYSKATALFAVFALAISVNTVNAAEEEETRMTLGILLYPGFELLDVYGPAEMFGNVGHSRAPEGHVGMTGLGHNMGASQRKPLIITPLRVRLNVLTIQDSVELGTAPLEGTQVVL